MRASEGQGMVVEHGRRRMGKAEEGAVVRCYGQMSSALRASWRSGKGAWVFSLVGTASTGRVRARHRVEVADWSRGAGGVGAPALVMARQRRGLRRNVEASSEGELEKSRVGSRLSRDNGTRP